MKNHNKYIDMYDENFDDTETTVLPDHYGDYDEFASDEEYIDEDEVISSELAEDESDEFVESASDKKGKANTDRRDPFPIEDAKRIMNQYWKASELMNSAKSVLCVCYGDDCKFTDLELSKRPDDVDDITWDYIQENANLYRYGKKLDDEAKSEMLDKLKLFIYDLLSKKYKTFTNYFPDLFNEACIGVLTGMDKYNPELSKPATFFKIYMIHEITEFINIHINKTTSHYAAHIVKVKRAEAMIRKDGREPTAKEIAQETGISAETVIQAKKIDEMKNEIHIDTPEYLEKEITQHFESPEQSYIKKENSELIYAAINRLSEDERDVVLLKYGLTGMEPMSYKNISEETQIPIDMVKKLANSAIRKLRLDRVLKKNFKNYIREEKILNSGIVGVVPLNVGDKISEEVDELPLDLVG